MLDDVFRVVSSNIRSVIVANDNFWYAADGEEKRRLKRSGVHDALGLSNGDQLLQYINAPHQRSRRDAGEFVHEWSEVT